MNNYSYPKRIRSIFKQPERSNVDIGYPDSDPDIDNPDPIQIYDPGAFDALVNRRETNRNSEHSFPNFKVDIPQLNFKKGIRTYYK
jgi:hypothetical protein